MASLQEHLPNRGVGRDKDIEIIVNGRKKTVSGKEISFVEVVELAFENPPYGNNTIFTVTFRKGHNGNKPEGNMVEGDTVKLKNGMIFNVTATDKS